MKFGKEVLLAVVLLACTADAFPSTSSWQPQNRLPITDRQISSSTRLRNSDYLARAWVEQNEAYPKTDPTMMTPPQPPIRSGFPNQPPQQFDNGSVLGANMMGPFMEDPNSSWSPRTFASPQQNLAAPMDLLSQVSSEWLMQNRDGAFEENRMGPPTGRKQPYQQAPSFGAASSRTVAPPAATTLIPQDDNDGFCSTKACQGSMLFVAISVIIAAVILS